MKEKEQGQYSTTEKEFLHQASPYWEGRSENVPPSPHRENLVIRNGVLITCAANHT